MEDEWQVEELSASLEAALQQAEQAYQQRRSGSSSGGPSTHTVAGDAARPAAAVPSQPAPRRRTLPAAVQSKPAAAVAGSTAHLPPPLPSCTAQPAAAATAAEAVAADAAPPQPVVRRRWLPAILNDDPPLGADEPSAAAADENLPAACFDGAVRYAFTGYDVDTLCHSLLHSGLSACGFDIEWRVTYQTGVAPRPVALIQLCFPQLGSAASAGSGGGSGLAAGQQGHGLQQGRGQQHCCLLLHIHHSGHTPHLRQLLCCKDILKVGVGSHGDALKMRRDFQLEMQGVVCLSEYANARLVGGAASSAAGAPSGGSGGPRPPPTGGPAAAAEAAASSASALPPLQLPTPMLLQLVAPQKWSLAGLVGLLMRQRLEKCQAVRCSDWERLHLSEEQRRYAATDAWASLRVYEILSKMPVASPPPHALAAGGPAAAPAATVEGTSCTASAAAATAAEDWVPPCAALRHLQPAKLAVYQALVQQGLSVQQVAAQRHIQEDSVQGYMAEAITAGLGYSWSCLGVPAAALQQVADVCCSLLDRPVLLQQPAVDGGGTAAVGGQAAEQQQRREGACRVGDKRPPPNSPVNLAAAAATGSGRAAVAAAGAGLQGGGSSAPDLGGTTTGAGGATSAPAGDPSTASAPAGGPSATSAPADEPLDILEQLLAAGHKLREIKEQRFAGISYGQLRLALAHLGRCNPGPWQ